MSVTGINLSDRGYDYDRDDRSHRTVEGEETEDGLKTSPRRMV